jgi:hypothetical protein
MCWKKEYTHKCDKCYKTLMTRTVLDRECDAKKKKEACNITTTPDIVWEDPANCNVCKKKKGKDEK